jgi:TusA-related sulfurtransferase
MAEQIKADLRGFFIPETVQKLEVEMTRIVDGDRILVLLDDFNSEDWILRWCHRNGHDILTTEKTATGLNLTIKKGGYITR